MQAVKFFADFLERSDFHKNLVFKRESRFYGQSRNRREIRAGHSGFPFVWVLAPVICYFVAGGKIQAYSAPAPRELKRSACANAEAAPKGMVQKKVLGQFG